MKYYFASRTKHKEDISQIVNFLKELGHDISLNWASLENLIPYEKNQKKSSDISFQISKALSDTDIFVLISDKGGTDMFVELGIAIANQINNKKPKIYIVGKHNKKSLMHFHPLIIHADSLKELFEKENINLPRELDFTLD